MAIGDTVNAGLMRIDPSAIERAGQANAKANEAFGNALGQVAKGYFVGQEKKARANEIKEELMRSGLPEEAAANISKNPFLQKEYARKKEAENRMDIAEMQAATSRANSSATRAQADKFQQDKINERNRVLKKAEEAEQAKGDFLGTYFSQVPTGEMNEAGQEEVANFQAFAAPEDPRTNPFIQETLQNPEFQKTEPVMDMTGNRFAQQFADKSPEVQQLALNFMQANAPKPMTPKELLDYEVKRNQELRDQAKEGREASEFKEENKPLPPVDSKYEEATLTAIDDALGFLTDDTKKFFSTGVIGQALSNIAGTDATSLRAKLDTITSGVGFGRLNDMREASKTGGALGNVSEIELRQLNASMGSLDPNQKPSELKKTLETIKEQYESTVRVLKAEKYAYDNGLTFKTPKEAMDFVNNFNASPPQQTANTIDPAELDKAVQAKRDLVQRRKLMSSQNEVGISPVN